MLLCMKLFEPPFPLCMNSEVVKTALQQFMYKCRLLFPCVQSFPFPLQYLKPRMFVILFGN